LLEVIKRYNYEGAPLPIVRQMAKQCLIGLDYLHRVCKVIHTDLKPENVSLCLTDEEVRQIATQGSLKQTKLSEEQVNHMLLHKVQDTNAEKATDGSVRGRGT